MRAEVLDYGTSFDIQLYAETAEEAALLIRIGMNAIRTPEYMQASAGKTVDLSIGFRRAANWTHVIDRTKP